MTTLLADPLVYANIRGVTYDPTDMASVLALEAASDAIRSFCNQQFDYVEDDEITLDGTGTDTLKLPELPVLSVAEVLVDDDELDAEDWVLDREPGLLRLMPGCDTVYFMRGYGNVSVTYTHGYVLPSEVGATLPADIQLACMQMAGTMTVEGGGIVESEGIGTYNVSFGSASDTATQVGSSLSTLQHYRQRELV